MNVVLVRAGEARIVEAGDWWQTGWYTVTNSEVGYDIWRGPFQSTHDAYMDSRNYSYSYDKMVHSDRIGEHYA